MLSSSSPKACHHMISSVVPSSLRQSSDWSAHRLISNGNKTHGNLFHTQWVLSAISTLGGQKQIYLETNQKIANLYPC